jgi:hypothetical protein
MDWGLGAGMVRDDDGDGDAIVLTCVVSLGWAPDEVH